MRIRRWNYYVQVTYEKISTKVDSTTPAVGTRSTSTKKRMRTTTTKNSTARSSPQSGRESFETTAVAVETDADGGDDDLSDDDISVSI